MRTKDKDGVVREQLDRLGRPTIEMLEREIARRGRVEAYAKLVKKTAIALLFAIVAILLVTNIWVRVLRADGTNMSPTLQNGDIVLAIQTKNAAKNEIIAFYHNNALLIRRVVATAGETVDFTRDGALIVNGDAVDEPYVVELSLTGCDLELPYQVPFDTVFVAGDNRPAAADSRSSRFGPVEKRRAVGKVVARIWPLARAGRVA